MATTSESHYIRLHITPFTPSLLTAILAPSVLPNARNISYHQIQTFPEHGYGYVELPQMDADKVKKRLNGSILKGTKVKIDIARPQKEHQIDEPEEPKPKKEKGKKRKRDEIPAVEIGDRQVKRGWTTPGAKVKKDQAADKKIVKSKYTTAPECLFKTVLPANVAANADPKASKPKRMKNKRAEKEAVVHEFSKTTKYATFLRGNAPSNKSKTVAEYIDGKGWIDEDGNVVETEAKISKVQPAKEGGIEVKKAAASIDTSEDSSSSSDDSDSGEGMGKTSGASAMVVGRVQASAEVNGHESDTSSGGSSTDGSESGEEKEASHKPRNRVEKELEHLENQGSETSSEGSSSADIPSEQEVEPDSASTPNTVKYTKRSSITPNSDSSSSEDELENKPGLVSSKSAENVTERPSSGLSSSEDSEDSASDSSSSSSDEEPAPKVNSRPQSASGPPLGLSIKIPSSTGSTPTRADIHPLEALYKRATPSTSDLTRSHTPSSFSFFGADASEDVEMEEGNNRIPLTPYSQHDVDFRGMRSAAPTPDTAHMNKRFIWHNEDEEDEDAGEGPSSPIRNESKGKGKAATQEKEDNETDFQKWFYENRGEANRAWKTKRRTAAKDKRQRENRKRGDRF